MNRRIAAGVVAALVTGSSVLLGLPAIASPEHIQLLLAGPVESINEKDGTLVVLGQKLSISPGVTVGDAVSVFGVVRTDGTLSVSRLIDHGVYVPGASRVLLTGVLQQVHS